MQITTDTLLDCIFLLINKNNPFTKEPVIKILSIYDEQQATNNLLDKPLADFYSRIIRTLIQQSIDKNDKDSLRSIILKFVSDPICIDYPNIAHQLEDSLLSEPVSNMRINQLKQSLDVILTQLELNNVLRRSMAKTINLTNYSTIEQQVSEAQNIVNETGRKLNEVVKILKTESDSYNTVDFDNIESLKEQFSIYNSRTSEDNVIKTGLQGLNIALGANGGFVPGQSIVFVAAAHQYKSSMLLSCALWSIKYNNLPAKDPLKKSLVYYVTLENEPNQNVKWIFDKLYKEANNYATPPEYNFDEMAYWLHDYLSTFDVYFRMERYPAGTFTTVDFQNRIIELENLGYEVKVAIIDYLDEMYKKTTGDGSRDLLIKYLITSLCDFTKERGITFITAHALNRSFRDMPDQVNIVKKINERHIADGPAIKKIPDVVFYLHLEYNSETKVRYLTVKQDKLRYFGDSLSESVKYFAYPFFPHKGIVDDVNGDPAFVRDIFGDTRYNFNDMGNIPQPPPQTVTLDASKVETPKPEQTPSVAVTEKKSATDGLF